MPRSLESAEIAGLPPTLHRLAKLVANGVPSALDEVLQLIRSGSPQSRLFIPALSHALDIQLPRDPSDTDVPTWERSRALDCLAALPDIPLQYCAELWPPVWAWTQFIHRNRDQFPNSAGWSFCITFLLITRHFGRHPEFADTSIIRAPRMGVILGHAWVVLLDAQDAPMFEKAFLELLGLVRRWMAIQRKNSPHEWAEGFEGSHSELSAIFLRHVKRYLNGPPDSASSAWVLGTAVIFLFKCRQFYEGSDARFSEVVVIALTTIIRRLAEQTPGKFVDQTLAFSILSLSSDFLRPHSYPSILAVVHAGIVPIILRCSRHRNPGSEDIDTHVQHTLEMVSRTVIHYPILKELEHSLPEIRRLLPTTHLVNPRTSMLWQKYIDVLDSRLALKKLYDSPEHVTLKACDCIACGKIQPKRELLRCSSCHAHYYCGLECQTTDWKDGHRENCALLRLRLGAPDYLSARNLSFLRAVLHADYIKQQPGILAMQFKFLVEHSPETDFYCLFSYAEATMRMTVHPTSALDPRWDYEVGRAARSEGRIEIHLVTVSEDEKGDWPRFFPLQSSNGMLQAGLRQIAAEILGGGMRLEDVDVHALISAAADTVIHIH
ncbi:hypothetical protein C8R47DRAFT_1329993 [Mycena vitilis]|nr:hypothetical protein C8R47DRAFT_1329993 [Mycena vitilis]